MAERDIYLLNPRELRPEVIAVAFAKTSRSPESFREIAAELSDAQSAEFHEKWVVGYGHASVAEHAVLHIAIENVSRLAIEGIESNRLASYTEKSTRYQIFGPDRFYVPEALVVAGHGALYRETCARLMQTYLDALGPLRALAQSQHPRKEGESDKRWDGRIRSKYVDHARFLLPAATLANVGMTANARVLEHAIRKLLSDPLDEARAIGAEIKRVAQAEVPTLVKYAEAAPYLAASAAALRSAARMVQAEPELERVGVKLVEYDPEAEEQVLAAALYRHGVGDWAAARAAVWAASAAERAAWLGALLAERGKHDAPVREIEHVTYTVDMLLDQGAYFEAKRHRMMTQSPQALTAEHGYVVPRAFVEAGIVDAYRAAQDAARAAYTRIAADVPHEAAYVVTNAFKRRVLCTLNLRAAYHFCGLRTAPNAHYSIRHTARALYEAIHAVHPTLAEPMRCADPVDAEAFAGEVFAEW